MTDPRPARRRVQASTRPRLPGLAADARCVIGCRQSVTDDGSVSLDFQEATLLRFAAERGWPVVAVERDEDARGWQDEARRPGHARNMDRCRRGEASIYLVYDLSRFARSARLQEQWIWELAKAGARVVSYAEPATDDPLIRMVFAGVHERRSEEISRYVTGGMAERARKGLPNAKAPFGLLNAPGKGSYTIDHGHPEKVALVRELFVSYARGESVPAIAERFTRTGPPPERSAIWRPRSLYLMLDCPAYAGHAQWSDVFVADAHEAIIDPATWAAVQARRASGKRARRPKSAGSWLEGNVLHSCGKPMYLHVRASGRHPSFLCASRGESLPSRRCLEPRPCLSVRKLEPAVLSLLADALDRAAGVTVAAVVRRAEATAARHSPDAARQRRERARALAEVARRRAKARELWLSDRCTLEEYDAMTAEADALVAALGPEPAAPAGTDAEAVRAALGRLRTLGGLVRRPAAAPMLGALLAEVAAVVVTEGRPGLRWEPLYGVILGGED